MKMEGVVFLHGIFRTGKSMAGMEKFFIKNGYKTLNVSYPSTKLSLEELAEKIWPDIEKFSSNVSKLHFVGYSMGGLVIRVLINKNCPKNLGSVVMLGTPNKGSEVADFMKNFSLYKKLYGPAGQQLVTDQREFLHVIGDGVDYELAVIAGTMTIDPISSIIIGKKNDGKVSVESTKIKGMKKHVTVPVAHTFFPQSRRSWKLALSFIKTGNF